MNEHDLADSFVHRMRKIFDCKICGERYCKGGEGCLVDALRAEIERLGAERDAMLKAATERLEAALKLVEGK